MIEFNKKIKIQFEQMCKFGKLFRVSITGKELWDVYLSSFENDPVFRDPESSYHNCNLCSNFVRRYGNIVAISENYEIMSLFDFEIDGEYQNVAKSLSNEVKSSQIKDVFFETYSELNSLNYEKCNKSASKFRLGLDKNHKIYNKEEAEKFGVVKDGEVRVFNHLHLDLPKEYVDMSNKSIESLMAEYRDAKNVFQRAMEEITLDTLNLVKDLINQGSLLDGTTHLYKVEQFIPLKKEYNELSTKDKDNWCWLKSYKLAFAKFKNELIGVLCSELSEGEEINKACQSWNKRVDPVNYMKASAPITQKQINEAKEFVEKEGYIESFDRRFATIEDIKASEIKHINVGDGSVKSVSIFDGVKSAKSQHKRNQFDGIEEVSIEKFMKDILPSCSSVEAFLTNSHDGNMVSLTTANNPESKPIFKWSNNYSWTFNGNLAGKSQIKEAVKSRGGNVEGILNIRLSFPNTTSDYDLHVMEPCGGHISYSNVRRVNNSSGVLDLDAQGVDGHQPPEKRVENVIYTDLSKMPSGKYLVYIDNYSRNGFKSNFTLEVEADNETTTLELENLLPSTNNVEVVEIHLNKGVFEIKPLNGIKIINSNTISKEIYGLETNQFHKVNLVSLSPNHWDDNSVGNKHYFFMLEGCKSDKNIRSFHNENLLPDLAKHRKVLEVLGTTNMIEPNEKQLSGLGFNSTVKDELIVKLSGNFKRVIKIKF